MATRAPAPPPPGPAPGPDREIPRNENGSAFEAVRARGVPQKICRNESGTAGYQRQKEMFASSVYSWYSCRRIDHDLSWVCKDAASTNFQILV